MFLLSVFVCAGVAVAIEEPKYTVEKKRDTYEIRSYDSMIVAETTVEAGFGEAGNKGFRILADYIFGNNTSRKKIEMTAPVSQLKSEKIGMTAPVSMSKSGARYVVQFTMPHQFNLTTLPRPNDDRVKIREAAKKRVAVFKYSGSWSETRYQEKLLEFKSALDKDKVMLVGEPIFARFNSPFQLWFLRRNEIWIEVTE
jgi:hypothetical protein